ncbi:hypothetical protein VZ94_21145 [Methylocucumis oryzae]|uniref:Uncharacterized protein n=1 Tax=Methylocucumis oryzae TaxID=1632867 RepID=A0A0F3IHS8_9GAMM|nr:hypothetical protein VZ94_21145 [Methylocucumis oryzae]
MLIKKTFFMTIDITAASKKPSIHLLKTASPFNTARSIFIDAKAVSNADLRSSLVTKLSCASEITRITVSAWV